MLHGRTANNGDVLFRSPYHRHEVEPPASVPGDSQVAVRRLRLFLDASPADVLEQQHAILFDDDEFRG